MNHESGNNFSSHSMSIHIPTATEEERPVREMTVSCIGKTMRGLCKRLSAEQHSFAKSLFSDKLIQFHQKP